MEKSVRAHAVFLDRGTTPNIAPPSSAYDAALTVYTRATDEVNWALAHFNRGLVWKNCDDGDRASNLREAIASF